MAQAVMEIWRRRLQDDGGAVFFDGLCVISFRGLKVAHQLMQTMRIWVCLVQSEIGCRRQSFVATRTPIGRFSRYSICCWQSFKRLESRVRMSGFQQSACHPNAKLRGSSRSENFVRAGHNLRKLLALECQVDLRFSADPADSTFGIGEARKHRLRPCLR